MTGDERKWVRNIKQSFARKILDRLCIEEEAKFRTPERCDRHLNSSTIVLVNQVAIWGISWCERVRRGDAPQ